ncbi:DUF305 domain-containing protein [Dactylosporangium fulvum]|uniref:DUF305 domain-containing protein n=1 Tax=Dactylosporangium fulvum TaxID=53359 RepID=A0ABY5VR00_9ACTN|nr:DUF305 domain-containing protein [Dactylosporangium fulvum]UWP79960.1 DUF305 domain-containing protein [Dactylosporangium fulvum]
MLQVVVAMVLLATGAAIGWLVPVLQRPGDASAEAGFVRDMQTHHAQAVEMSMILYGRSSNQELRTVAMDIALTQQAQIGMMRSLLKEWHLEPTGPDPVMAWMHSPASARDATPGADMSGMQMTVNAEGLMPGMASAAELNRLRKAASPELDLLFCELMTRHHLGGIMMVDAVLARTDRQQVRDLAEPMRTSQRYDITLFGKLTERIKSGS